jgi:nucleoid-associated protein YgaU
MSEAALLGRLLAGSCEVDERLLEALLAEGLPAAVAARRAAGGRWHMGVALLVGSAIALGAAGPAAAREAVAPAAATHAVVLPAPRPTVAPAEAAALIATAPAVARAAVADAGLETGLVLMIPGLTVEAQQNTTPTNQLYTVVSGDTLSAIALRFYGDASYWTLIYESNLGLISNPNLIFPGQTFTLPGANGSTTLTPGSQNPVGRGPGVYTVSYGDTLWSIAQFAYGNPYRWIDIYNANTGIIGANPGLIFSGTVLTIPA